ncbi:protein FAM200B-like [Aphis craccivora]|uniref:Protein FAM200B-like n=1 Tax=Aphis craccivora TaxID=307492 RepID=A0A6G0YHQ5_APHCR|nr:protein FAM200B-like [Aphis craccivora]
MPHKSYISDSLIMSQKKCPTVLKTFFNDPVSIAWLYFVQSQLKVVCDTIKKIEGDHISACENNPTFKFDEDEFFDEFNHVINVVKVKIQNWKNGSKAEDRWCEIFETLEKNNISIKYFTIILEYSMAFPRTNATVERVFSITNVLWTNEKNHFLVNTIRSIIIIKQHFKNFSSTEFHTFLLEHPQLLKLISSSEKYEKSNSEDTSEQSSSK